MRICFIVAFVYNPARDLFSERGFRMTHTDICDKVLAHAIESVLGIAGIHEAQLRGQDGYGEVMPEEGVQGVVDAWSDIGPARIPQMRITYSLPTETDSVDGYVMQAPVRREALKLEVEDALRPYEIFIKEWNAGRDDGIGDGKRWLEFVFDTRATKLRSQDFGMIVDYLTDIHGLMSVILMDTSGERLEIMNEKGAPNDAFTESCQLRRIVAKCDYVRREPLAIWEDMAWVFEKFGYIPILRDERYDTGDMIGEWRFVILEKKERGD